MMAALAPQPRAPTYVGIFLWRLVVYLAPHLFPPDRLSQRVAVVATAFPLAMVLSFMVEVRIPFRVS